MEGHPFYYRDVGDNVRDEARVRPGRPGGGAQLYVQFARHPEQQHDPWSWWRRLSLSSLSRPAGGSGGATGRNPGPAGEAEGRGGRLQEVPGSARCCGGIAG